MPHGSKHPDSRDGEKMCPHCGGWYDSRGWNTHIRSCNRQGEGKKANFSPDRPPSAGGKGDPNSQDDEQQGSESKPSPESNSGLGLGGNPPQEDHGSPRGNSSSTPRPTDVDEPAPSVDDLPEKYISTLAFVHQYGDEYDDVDLPSKLEPYDVVDMEMTKETGKLHAKTLEDVAAEVAT